MTELDHSNPHLGSQSVALVYLEFLSWNASINSFHSSLNSLQTWGALLKKNYVLQPWKSRYGLHLKEAVLLEEMADSGSGIINGQEEHQRSCQLDSQEAMVLSKDPRGPT